MTRKDDIKKLRETLIRRRDAMKRALKGDLSLLQELHQQKTGDFLDAAADSVQDELNSQLVEVESRELNAIEEALLRISDGRYGKCEACNKSIPMTRLRAIPYATDCIDCRRLQEQQRKGGSTVKWNRIYDNVEADPV